MIRSIQSRISLVIGIFGIVALAVGGSILYSATEQGGQTFNNEEAQAAELQSSHSPHSAHAHHSLAGYPLRQNVETPTNTIVTEGILLPIQTHQGVTLELFTDTQEKIKLTDPLNLFDSFYAQNRDNILNNQRVSIEVGENEFNNYDGTNPIHVFDFALADQIAPDTLLSPQALPFQDDNQSRYYANILCTPGSDAIDEHGNSFNYIDGMMSDPNEGVEHYFETISYGNFDFEYVTLPRITLPGNKSFWAAELDNDIFNVWQACIDQYASEYGILPNYQEIDSVHVFITEDLGQSFDGIATLSPSFISSDFFGLGTGGGNTFVPINLATTVYNSSFNRYINSTVVHEIGHNYGWRHSGINNPYDSEWDVMSDGDYFDSTYGLVGGGTFVSNVYQEGWVTPSQVFDVNGQATETGEFTFDLERSMEPTTTENVYLGATFEVPGSFSSDRIWLETKTDNSFNQNIPAEGVMVYYQTFYDASEFTTKYNQLIDFDGNSNINDAGAVISVGESYEIADTGITVAVNSSASDQDGITSFNVTVDVPERPLVERTNGNDGFVIYNDERFDFELEFDVTHQDELVNIDRIEVYETSSFFNPAVLVGTDSTAPFTHTFTAPNEDSYKYYQVFAYDENDVRSLLLPEESEFYVDFTSLRNIIAFYSDSEFDGLSPSPTSEVYFNNQIIQAVRGLNNGIFTRTSLDGQNWSIFTELGGRTLDTIEQYAFNGTLYQVIRGGDNGIYMRTSQDGVSYTPWSFQGGRTLSSVTMVEFDNTLFQFLRGGDNAIYQRSTEDGTEWTSWTQYGGRTKSRPEIIVFEDKIVQSVQGFSNNAVYTRSTTNGTTWSGWNLDGQTRNSPEMEVYNGILYHTVRGVNSNALYMRTSNNGTTWTGWSFIGASGLDTPEFEKTDRNLIQLVKGGDRNMYIRSTVDGTTWTEWEYVITFNEPPFFNQLAMSNFKPSLTWYEDPDTTDTTTNNVLLISDTTLLDNIMTRAIAYPE